ncbi:MAG: hypothetical protein HKN45_00700 [Flavobacteriales bacterium]|nr:hypothetical protein [Flavobacteriales bacterium]
MTIIESKKVQLDAKPEVVVNYAKDLNNFQFLLPKDRISDFESDGKSCSFKIQGLSKIGLTVEEVKEDLIVLRSTESPFSFSIDVHIDEQNGGGVEAYQKVNLDLNPMMKMMVEKPLRNLFDHIADRLRAELS